MKLLKVSWEVLKLSLKEIANHQVQQLRNVIGNSMQPLLANKLNQNLIVKLLGILASLVLQGLLDFTI